MIQKVQSAHITMR